MIKAVLFDLDGVLLDSRKMHFDTLNEALACYAPSYVISAEEHESTFNGLPTKRKLSILAEKGLSITLCDRIFKEKQRLTSAWVQTNVVPDQRLVNLFNALKVRGLKVGIVSNAVSTTLAGFINQSGLQQLVDCFISNEDVQRSKPHPEPYQQAMKMLGIEPEECLVVEDSVVGVESALRASTNVFHVTSTENLITRKQALLEAISTSRNSRSLSRITVPDLNVVVPMAGKGSRFKQAGFKQQKPFIDINGKKMIELVIESLGVDAECTFIMREPSIDEDQSFDNEAVLSQACNKSRTIFCRSLTEGAACTVLLAKEFIDNERPLLIANSDQYVVWDYVSFMNRMNASEADAGILTFKANDPKWSYAKNGPDGYVTQVAEKVVISTDATVGIYYWKHGCDFVRYAERMIAANARVKGEFYVCPVFNEAISDGAKVITHQVASMEGLGTPEDLEIFLAKRTV